MFYLESVMYAPGEEKVGQAYQDMFLVVRSLKHGNEKVDYQI